MAATKMTQTQMVRELAESVGVNNKQAKQFVMALTEMAVRETKKNGMFVIPGIGRLVRVERKARTGRNPATGEGNQDPGQEGSKIPRGEAAKIIVRPRKPSSRAVHDFNR